MRLPGGHLTYCSNIHPGERWQDVAANLRRHVPAVRDRVNPGRPFGIGLRLSAAAAQVLSQPRARREFSAWLDREDAYVFTVNGFPYGPFHGVPVKQGVYRPDWSDPERLRYTEQLVDILAALVPEGVTGSISTVPGGFRFDPSAEHPEKMAGPLIDLAVRMHVLQREQGVELSLGLEPEPMCMLETTAEAIQFFEAHLLDRAAREHFARRARCSPSEAETSLRRHLGVCFDTCHAAVEFESPQAGPASLQRAGIRISKCQVTSGLSIPQPTDAAIERLSAFADETYLHQVVIQSPNGLIRYLDLEQPIAAYRAGTCPPGPWRVHFHVPVYLEGYGSLNSTQAFVRAALPTLRGQTDHFEVETYTWGVLPSPLTTFDIDEAISRELMWTMQQWDQA